MVIFSDKDLTTPRKKQRSETGDYVKYLQSKLDFERERFELERREMEARLERDKEMLKMMMAIAKRRNECSSVLNRLLTVICGCCF